MTIEVKIVTNAPRNKVKQEAGRYKVYVTAPPVDGKANLKLIEVLAEYFDVKKSSISIKYGHTSRYKVVEIIQ